MIKTKKRNTLVNNNLVAEVRPEAGRQVDLPKSMWSASISFGLVNIPIRLHAGVRQKNVKFHLLHAKDNARLKRKYFCSAEDKEVPPDEIKKAYEVSKGEEVIVEKEELEELHPKSTNAIDILYFVEPTEIDPAYFDRPFYLMPTDNAKKAYQLLVEALKKTAKGGICQFSMRNKTYIGLVRAVEHVLTLETMHFEDEVISVNELKNMPATAVINDRELKAAQSLVESLVTKFEPEKLQDHYRQAVMKLIDKKMSEGKVVQDKPGKKKDKEDPGVIDLMAALEKSLEEVKKHRGRKAA